MNKSEFVALKNTLMGQKFVSMNTGNKWLCKEVVIQLLNDDEIVFNSFMAGMIALRENEYLLKVGVERVGGTWDRGIVWYWDIQSLAGMRRVDS